MRKSLGRVYLVGAGPGDPGLMTVRGMDVIRRCDVIVYDRLANPVLLHAARPDCEKIYVGKQPDHHTYKQEEINALLVKLALEGKVVTRLKGGDPNVFGRVGEEAAELAHHGIKFEIVPGITSAISVPAYAGIPVTHRDVNTSFTVVTGHERPEKLESSIDWANLPKGSETLLFLMGVARLSIIVSNLIKHGRPSCTPIALVRMGTRPEQETLVGTLETIVAQVEQANFQAPAVIIVGEVVNLRAKLNWFEQKPMFGKRFLVARSHSRSLEAIEQARDMGAEVVEFPLMQMKALDALSLAHLDACLGDLHAYSSILFSSEEDVTFFFDRMFERGIDIRQLLGIKIYSDCQLATALLRKKGIVPEIMASMMQMQGHSVLHVNGKTRTPLTFILSRKRLCR